MVSDRSWGPILRLSGFEKLWYQSRLSCHAMSQSRLSRAHGRRLKKTQSISPVEKTRSSTCSFMMLMLPTNCIPFVKRLDSMYPTRLIQCKLVGLFTVDGGRCTIYRSIKFRKFHSAAFLRILANALLPLAPAPI